MSHCVRSALGLLFDLCTGISNGTLRDAQADTYHVRLSSYVPTCTSVNSKYRDSLVNLCYNEAIMIVRCTESKIRSQVVGIVCESRINALPYPFGCVSITESKNQNQVGGNGRWGLCV